MTANLSCSDFGTILDSFRKVIETIALIVGGLWAYYKFFKGRTFKPRLELTLSGSARPGQNLTHVIACIQIKNVGLTKLKLSQVGSGLRILSYTSSKTKPAPTAVEWEHLMTLSVFEKHNWIEPGETVIDQTLVEIAGTETIALRLELRIVSSRIEWNAVSIVEPPAGSEPGVTKRPHLVEGGV